MSLHIKGYFNFSLNLTYRPTVCLFITLWSDRSACQFSTSSSPSRFTLCPQCGPILKLCTNTDHYSHSDQATILLGQRLPLCRLVRSSAGFTARVWSMEVRLSRLSRSGDPHFTPFIIVCFLRSVILNV